MATTTQTTLSVDEVGETLARLLRDARPGDEIILERDHVAVARVVPVTPELNGAHVNGAAVGAGDAVENENKRRTPIFGTGGPIIMRDDFDDPAGLF